MSADDVINWSEAMDQCGDDEEFLTELLSDLRGEVDAQMVKIDDALKVSWLVTRGILYLRSWIVGVSH